jgi:hypothetical protein
MTELNLALYKEGNYLTQSADASFDKDHVPGNAAAHAGIYRCMGCHREIGVAAGHTLPPQGHHTHTASQGSIRWRMIVWADHNPK